VIQAENSYRLALNGLKISLGIPFDRAVAVQDTLALAPVPDSLMDRAVDLAVRQNRMLSALRRQSDLNDALISVERSAYMPTLAAFGTYQWTLQTNAPRFALNDFISSSTVGLTISMNIFNGLQTNARVDQARLEYRKSQEQVSAMEQATQTGTESTVGRLRRALERIQVQERTVEQAERGYRIARTRYTSGAGTLLEVNDAHLAMINAKVNRIQALYDHAVAAAELDQLLGRMPSGVKTDEP
jgi:outer membrane protein TolC